MSLEHGELTEQIIGAAIAVHRSLGPGFLEAIYERALEVELKRRGLRVDRQVDVKVRYEGEEVGEHRLDMLVNDLIIVELKAVGAFKDIYFAIVRSYLKAMGLEHGLLLNFGVMPLGIKRVIFTP